MAENKLTFLDATIPYSKHSLVAQTRYSNKAFVISNDTLYELEFTNNTQVIIRTTKDSQYPLEDAKLLFVEPLNDKQTAIIVKVTGGIRIYLHSKDSLQLFVEDDQFHDSFEWNKPGNSIQFGHFYHDSNILGMMSSHLTYGTKFYAIFKDVLLSGDFPIYPLDTNYDILETFSPKSLNHFLVDLNKSSRRAIESRNSEGLTVFELNKANGIDFVLKGPHCGRDDAIFFVNLTHQKYNDIVHFNSSGLFVYKYDDSYKFIHYNPLFSEEKGWTTDHTRTVRFVDMNKDGSTDMVFTGPTGVSAITFNELTNSWTLLVDTSKLPPSMRHAKILHVVPKVDGILNDTYFITHQDGRINWAKIDQLPVDPPQGLDIPSFPTPFVAKSDMIQLLTPRKFKNKLLLRDMDIWSQIQNCVDGKTGKPRFFLPLVNLSNPGLKLILNYDATKEANDILGIGWYMPLNLIAMDDGGSIFGEDAVFVIAFQDSMQALKYLPNESSSNVLTYGLQSMNTKLKFRAKFYTDDDKWVVDLGNGIQQTYGQIKATGQGAIAKDIVWKNWHGAGSDSENQLERSRMWYLAKVQDQHNNVLLEFFYNIDTVTVNSELSYTNAVYLKKSRDYEGNEIEFRYEEKQANEYKKYDPKDKDGNYNWAPVQTRYLSGYTFTERSSEGGQTVNFVYSLSNGNRFLKEIHQAEDAISKCVAKFDYLNLPNGKFSLQRALLPYEVQVDFTYVPVGDINMSNVQKKLDVPSDYRVTTGQNYVLVSFLSGKSPAQVVLRMFNRDMTDELYNSDPIVHVASKGKWPLLGEHKSVVGHEVIRGDDYFAVILYYGYAKWLCLLGRVAQTGEWLDKFKCHEYGEKAEIKAGKEFCLISDPGSKVELIEWKSMQGIWKQKILIEKPDHVTISVYENRFVTYDNSQISVGYKTREGIWNHTKLANIQNCLSGTENILKRFNLKEDFHKMISFAFRNNILKFSRNLIALNCLEIKDQQLQSSLKLYTIDRHNKVSINQEIIINHDDLATFVSKEEEDKDGTFYVFKYELQSNGEFYIKLVKFWGTLYDKLGSNLQRYNARKSIEKSMNSPAQRLLIDFQSYIMYFKDQMIICHDKKVIFGGNRWWQRGSLTESEKNDESLSVTLGENFILEKANKDAKVELLRKSTRQVLVNLPVNITDIRVFYPIYMATQEKGKAVRVIDFEKDNAKEIEVLPLEEKISPYSNPLTLITHQGDDSKIVTFRQQYGVKKFLPNHVVRQVTVVYDNDRKSRITGYEYDTNAAKLTGNTIVYSKYSIIPGNDKNSYGWLEVLSKNGSSTAYNSHGEFVKHIPPDEKQSDDQEESKEDKAFREATTIYDKSGRLEIANCAPYRLADESVGYYGFEDYESNVIGSSKKWNFQTSNVIRNGHSLTGKNYLQQKTEPIEGVFQPIDQNIQYLASSWIRLQNITKIPRIGEVTPFLKATVLSQSGNLVVTLLSQIKYRLDDWIYLELIVDLPLARKQFKIDSKSKLQVAIRVGPSETVYTDIDHIRFGPLLTDWNVKVYDSSSSLNTAVIRSTGAILRRVYDNYNSIVSKINEENQVEELTVYTKAGKLTSPRCTVKIQPNMGFYEQFSPFSFANRWKIDKVDPWKIAPYQLEHYSDERNSLELHTRDIATESYGFRVLYSLDGNQASLGVNDFVELLKYGEDVRIKAKTKGQSIPKEGELLVVKEKNRFLLWINGDICIDEASDVSDRSLKISMTGRVSIKDMIIFSKPSIRVIFQNSLDEPTQEISLESAESIIVKEKLYDELGRQRIATQHVRIVRSKFEPLLRFIPNFVTNAGTSQSNSIWKTGLLEGLAATVLGYPYSFSETQYESNPLNEKSKITLPGKDFSSSGAFAKRFASKMTNLFVANRYPLSTNVSYQVELKPGGLEDITVFNQQNKRIAHFVHVPGGKDLFSTYKFNDDGNLLQVLPPLYFERVGSFNKTNSDLMAVNEEDYKLQRKLGVHFEYDQHGRPIRKTTPDAGPIENIYDSNGLLRFILHYSYTEPNSVETITYITYDPLGRVINTGQLKDTQIPKDKLLSTTLNENNSVEYQLFNYGNTERDPNLRGRLMRAITINDYVPFAEVKYVNYRGATMDKRIIIPKSTGKPNEISISNKYLAGCLQQISYPAKFLGSPFVVFYGYDKLGRVNSVGIPGDPNRFLQVSHNAAGRVTEEIYEPNSVYTFKNRRDYNEPGFLIRLSNPFLSEEISYTDSGYGGAKRGDGSITRIKFSANWHDSASSSGVGLNPNSFVNESMSTKDSKTCFEALKQAGYLNEKNRQIKAYFPALEHDFPIICTSGTTGRHVSNVLGRLGYPHEHGYRFDYGALQDLTKAKYFVGTDEADPLQPEIFAKEIRGISIEASQRIWKALKKAKFLIEDPDRTNLSTSQGKESQKSFIGSKLFDDLRHINPDYAFYAEPIRKLLTSRYFKRQMNITLLQMQKIISRWLGNSSASNSKVQRTAADVFEMLRQKRYFSNPLDGEFQSALTDFKDNLTEIVRVLFTYFGKQLGHSEFDVESYEIDANGNKRMFNTGYHHYALKYEKDSNRIEGVQYKAFDSSQPVKIFRMRHDSRGNVIEALHNGIASMEYHPVSNFLKRARLVNGRTVEFYYDSKGERVLKRLRLPDGKVHKEIHYLRDDKGRSLVERELSFFADNQPPTVMITMYVYGPNGLIGFIRRDLFFSVVTDHQGSVRLIVRDGEVVAAYDYLPYGTSMRIFGADPDAHISYRYTGQEWDPEIGLYNCHERFYDPVIGRFYQIDPKEQYFSPYVYAGNSPVSMIDPDGDFAMLVIALLSAAVGAYMSAAAVNGTINISEWELNSETIIAAAFGGALGFSMLPGLFASAEILAFYIGTVGAYTAVTSLGLAMAYFSAAAANGSMSVRDWDWYSPRTYYAMFEGFAMGVTAIKDFQNIRLFYNGLEANGKKLFLQISAVSSTGLFIMGGIATDWDISTPQFWFAMVSVALSGPDLGILGVTATRAIQNGYKDLKLVWNYKKYVDEIFRLKGRYNRTTKQAFMEVYYSNLELSRTIYFLGFAAGAGVSTSLISIALNHNLNNWNMAAVSTYQNLITAIQIGGHGVSAIHGKLTIKEAIPQLENSIDARQFTDRVASRAIEVYNKLIEEGEFEAKDYRDQSVRTSLNSGKVPNTVLAVGTTDGIAIVGFSTNTAPGLYLVFDHNNMKNPLVHIVRDNAELAGKEVVARDDPILNGNIVAAVGINKDAIKQKNLLDYLQQTGREGLLALAAKKDWIVEDVRERIVDAIHQKFMATGSMDKGYIKEQLDAFNFNSNNQRITAQATLVDDVRKNSPARTVEQREARKLALDDLRAELKATRNKERNEFIDMLFEPLKDYRERFTNWDIHNCAEVHVLQAIERQKNIWNREVFRRKWHDPQLDVQYMASYWVEEFPTTPGAQRCDNCLVSTGLVPNVLTDINFSSDLERIIQNGERNIEEFLFVIPAISRHNAIEEEEKRTKNQNRKTRSVVPSGWYDQPMRWIKAFKNLTNRSANRTQSTRKTILELGDEFLSKININGTLLLADVILAKCQRRKVYQVPNDTVHELNTAELLCNVLQLFEDGLQKATNISGISLNCNNVDLFTMQQEVLPLLKKHQFEKVSDIMCKYALEGLHNDTAYRAVDKFKLAFQSLQMNRTIEELVRRMERVSNAGSSGIDMAYNASHRMGNMPNINEGLGVLSNNQKFLN